MHGSERCFRKFLNTAKFYDAQYLILGGDITGKTLVPIEKGPTGWRASFNDHDYRDMSDEEMREVEQRIRDGGRYPIRGERDELLELFSRGAPRPDVPGCGRRGDPPLDGHRRRATGRARTSSAT